jgi:hypothetical protein
MDMNYLTAAILEAMEQAAMSGLCRDGQLAPIIHDSHRV